VPISYVTRESAKADRVLVRNEPVAYDSHVSFIAQWLVRLSHALLSLVRDLTGASRGASSLAQVDDVLDARGDDDGMDTTGL
jgi:hypothetical protein